MATAKKLASVELGTKVTNPRGADAIVKGWAIGILDPRTQFNEDYTNAFLDSFFKGKLGIVVLTQIALQEGGSGFEYFVAGYQQPYLSTDSVFAIAVLHENKSQFVDEEKIKQLAQQELNGPGCRTRSNCGSGAQPASDDLNAITKRLMSEAYANNDSRGHFNRAESQNHIWILRESSPGSLVCGAAERDGSGASEPHANSGADGGGISAKEPGSGSEMGLDTAESSQQLHGEAAAGSLRFTDSGASVTSPVPSATPSKTKEKRQPPLTAFFTPNCKAGPSRKRSRSPEDRERHSDEAAAMTPPISGASGAGKRGRESAGSDSGSKRSSGSLPKSSSSLADCCEHPIAMLLKLLALLKDCPRSTGVEHWYEYNDSKAPSRRKLLACRHPKSKIQARDTELANRMLAHVMDRIQGVLVASCSSDTRGTFKAEYSQWIEECVLPVVSSAPLRKLLDECRGDVAQANEAASASGEEQTTVLCFVCKKDSSSLFCVCGFGYCAACSVPVKGQELRGQLRNGSLCKTCTSASNSVLQRIRFKANGSPRKILIAKNAEFQVAANYLVNAVHQGADIPVDALLGPMFSIVIEQLKEGISPCFTPAQIMCLIGRNDDYTDRLLHDVAQAHADHARHRAIGLWRPAPIVQTGISSHRRIAYLAGGISCVRQASSVLRNHTHDNFDVWLIIRSEDGCADSSLEAKLVQEFADSERLLRLDSTISNQEQAESIRKLGLDVLLLICPPESFDYILSCHPALFILNWLGLSGTRSNLCDFTLVCSSGVAGSHEILVGFDQPIMEINETSGFVNRESVGFPKRGAVMFFPGSLDQIDKNTFSAWIAILDKTDNTFLAMTAEPADKMAKIRRWMGQHAFDKRRWLILPWQGETVHSSRQIHSILCMGPLCPTKVQNNIAGSLAMGTGLLVCRDKRGTPLCVGCDDLNACGLSRVLVSNSKSEYIANGVAWMTKFGREGNSFLREKQRKNEDYYDPKRVPSTIEKAIDLMLDGQQSINLSNEIQPSSLFEDMRETRIELIIEELKESLKPRSLFGKGFRSILDFLSSEYGLVFNSVNNVVNEYRLQGTLMAPVACPKAGAIKLGANVTLHIEKTLRPITTLHNSLAFRSAANAHEMQKRMRSSKNHSRIFNKPVNLLNEGRSCIGLFMVHPGTKQVIVFWVSDAEHEEPGSYEEAHNSVALDWHEQGIIPESLSWKLLHPFLLSLHHAHCNGMMIQQLNLSNVVLNNQGGVAFSDLALARLFPPKHGNGFGRESGPTNLTRRSTVVIPNAQAGDFCRYKASGKPGTKDSNFRFVTDSDLRRGERLSRDKGLGGCGRGDPTYFDKAEHERRENAGPNKVLEKGECAREDVFQHGRGVLRLFHQVRGNAAEWEKQALAATADGDPQKVLEFMLKGRRVEGPCLQPRAALTFAKYLAEALRPGPDRASILNLMTHAAATSPIFSSEDEACLALGGIPFLGGRVGDLGVSNHKWLDWVIPPTAAQYEPAGAGERVELGVGVKSLGDIEDGGVASFYVGKLRKESDGKGVFDYFPTRYGVSVNSKQQGEKIVADAAGSKKLTIQWFKTHQVTGPFLNAGDWRGGKRSNVRLDRDHAWTDPATGLVWIPMFALRPIAAGEFLRWKYDPTAGQGGAYNFKLG